MYAPGALVLLALVALARATNAAIRVSSPEALERLFNFEQLEGEPAKRLLDPLDLFLEDILPTWFNQAPNNENGTRAELSEYALRDRTNDDASRLSSQQLIARSGFRYEVFDAIADDGYITQMTRLINPRAEPLKLRRPPVLIEHGGTIDPSAYLIASSIQHMPEPWPRRPEDGPMRSWNRSLAFALANNGFDVWLAETRGSNDNNKRNIRAPAPATGPNSTIVEKVRESMKLFDYWTFSQDDIIAYELKSHIDTVLQVTGATKVNLLTFSLSTPTSLAFLGEQPEYAAKVQGFVSMAPIISGQGTSKFVNLLLKTVCPMVPDELGTLILTDLIFAQPFRELLLLLSKRSELRYILIKSLSTLLLGPSPKYATLLELNLVGHLYRQLSFRVFKQMCQQMASNKLQKYDYGPVQNQLLYKQPTPPVYNITDLHINDWIVVSGSNDGLSTRESVEFLLSIVHPKPVAHIIAPNFNHLDLFAGWDNDIYVNGPIMRYFERMSYTPGEQAAGNYARALDLNAILPPALQPAKLMHQARNITKQLLPNTPLDSEDLVDLFTKSLTKLVESFARKLPKLPFLDALNQPAAAASYGARGRCTSGARKLEGVGSKQEELTSGGGSGDGKSAGEGALSAIERTLEAVKPPNLEKLLSLEQGDGGVGGLLNPKETLGQMGAMFGRLGQTGAGGSSDKSGGGGDKNSMGGVFDGLKALTGGDAAAASSPAEALKKFAGGDTFKSLASAFGGGGGGGKDGSDANKDGPAAAFKGLAGLGNNLFKGTFGRLSLNED